MPGTKKGGQVSRHGGWSPTLLSEQRFMPALPITVRGCPPNRSWTFPAALHVVPILDLDDLAVSDESEVSKNHLIRILGDVAASI